MSEDKPASDQAAAAGDEIAADLDRLNTLSGEARVAALAAVQVRINALPSTAPTAIAEIKKANNELWFGPAAPAPTEQQKLELHQRNVRAALAHRAKEKAEAEREAVAARDAERAETDCARLAKARKTSADNRAASNAKRDQKFGMPT
jgi:hypothetical protein